MKFLAARSRHRQLLTSLVAASMLCFCGGQAFAACLPTMVAPARASIPGHFLESVPALSPRASCTGESSSRATAGAAANSTARLDAIESSKWSLAGTRSAQQIATEQARNVGDETSVQQSLSEVHWADSRDWIHNPPEWLQEAKNYRRQGMPILHLMQSQDKSTLLAIGISNHGKPGLYLTRKLPF